MKTAEDVLHWVFEAYNRATNPVMHKADTKTAERLAQTEKALDIAIGKLAAIRAECERVLPDHAEEHPYDRIMAIIVGGDESE